MKKVFFILIILTIPFCLMSKEEKKNDTGRNPFVATLLSIAIPGGGQFYNKDYLKGIAFFTVQVFYIKDAAKYDEKILRLDKDSELYEVKYQSYYKKKQSKYGWFFMYMFLSAVDAYASAALYNYEEEKKGLYLDFRDEMIGLSYDF